ncbi:MAG: DUF3883 domain-containing protein [Bacillota bacterium]|nr:DUF3883 domain-containing protein [Bacillota bacterium]
MLDVLRNIEYRSGKEGLLFFICDVVGNGKIGFRDAEIIYSHTPGKHYLSIKDVVSYCIAFDWIQETDNVFSLSPFLLPLINDKQKLNEALIKSTIEKLFAEKILASNMFFYDAIQCCYAFKNELFPLFLSSVRNVLISQGFLIQQREYQGTRLYIAPVYDTLVAKHCKARQKQLSLESLKKQLENKELAGEKAELFVLSYEKKRIGQPLCENIKRISEVDVAAGYDIVSFHSSESQMPNRFIEVKAISSSGFYWSRNEYEIAKLKGEAYYLYLVELGRIDELDYSPEMIQNPAINVMETDDWFVESQSYFIKRV